MSISCDYVGCAARLTKILRQAELGWSHEISNETIRTNKMIDYVGRRKISKKQKVVEKLRQWQ